MLRYTLYFSGHVQGVGFRFTARRIALTYRVSGYVENLDDGRVLLVAEGEPDELDRFLGDLSDQMGRFIKSRTVARCEATGEFGTPGIDPLTVRR
ncbi:MAG: acylphosphatase [Planctomycetes bacterium]|nr:acylphosphatase [Planctomycetota bacterium]